ncbi:MAG: helix-turn-helix domain-containing protein [Defluviitaleaceae bacterium]|nr:helix-turn-helix domain-containing protein [Defluviitaleaceae bacterium]
MNELRLRELREAKEMLQAQVAAYLQVARTTYARYETGEREMTYNSLIRLADLYGVSVDYLLGRIDDDCVVLSEDEKELVDGFGKLDKRGQSVVLAVLAHETKTAKSVRPRT